MSKRILGDNPFTSDEQPAPAEVDHASTSSEHGATEIEAAGEPAAPDSGAGPGDTQHSVAAAGDDSSGHGDSDDHLASQAQSVPDAATASPLDYFDAEDLELLGAEAAVPTGDYGPPISSRFPEPGITPEVRELADRVDVLSTPVFPIEHQRQLPLSFFWKRYRYLAMRDRSSLVDEFGRDPVYMARYEPLLDFLYKVYFRVETSGLDHVPDTGRALLVANHAGTLPYDAALITYAMRREHPARRDARPLVEDFVFHFPYLGTFINRIGGVRACPENAQMLLEQDEVIVVFPEGVKGVGKLYKDRYRLQRFGRGGFIKLALKTRAPIIPVAIIGAEDTNPMLGKVTWLAKSLGLPHIPITPTFPWLGPAGLAPLPSKWYMRFGEPIDVSADHTPSAADDRILVNKLADNVRSTIQQMVDETLAERRPSVWSTFFAR